MVLNRVLDTNIILYLLGNKLSEPMPLGHYYASVITEMELLSFPALTKTEEKVIRDFLADIQVVGILPDIKENAIRLRRDHKLKLPDAIIAATALSLDALLLTNDNGIIRVPGLKCKSVSVKD
jgi:predicted nucleic acid-binding protein